MTILDEIVVSKRAEVAIARVKCPLEQLVRRAPEAPSPRDFRAALLGPGPIRLIAEIKKASPSAQVIRADFDPAGDCANLPRPWGFLPERVDRHSFFSGACSGI